MFKGNRDVDTLQDLGTTMNIPMSSKITLSGLPEENAEIYNKILDENIFAPIAKQVNKPKITVETKKRGKRKTLSKKEKYIDEHLDKICKLVGKLNNNDIEMIENMRKTKNQDFRNKDDIQREY